MNHQKESSTPEDIARCWQICRNFQDRGAIAVMRKIKAEFPEKSGDEILDLVEKVKKLTGDQDEA